MAAAARSLWAGLPVRRVGAGWEVEARVQVLTLLIVG